MSEVSGNAVCGFLACLFPGLIVAMTATCAIIRRSDNSVALLRFHARASAAAPGKTKRIVTTAAHIVGDQAHRQNGSAHRRYHRCEYTSRCRTIRNGSIAVAGAQVGSTPSVSREVFLSHTSRCSVQFSSARGGGRGRGGARSAARRGARRVSEWAKALGRKV